MEKKYIKIDVNGKKSELVATDESEYSVLSTAVGGLVEMVPAIFDDHFLYLNEEGKLIGMEINALATDLARGLNLYDMIVGDVVLVGPLDDEGYHKGVSDFVLRSLNVEA